MKKKEILANELSEYLKKARERSGLTVRALCSRAGISPGLYSLIENHPEHRTPSPKFLYSISNPLGASFSELLYYAGYIPPRNSDGLAQNAIASLPVLVFSSARYLFHRNSERKIYSLFNYLCQQKGLTMQQLGNKLSEEYGYADDLLSLSNMTVVKKFLVGEGLINISHSLDTNPDELLFLLGRLPDYICNNDEHYPSFSAQIAIFKQALRMTELTDLSNNIDSNQNSEHDRFWQTYFAYSAKLQLEYEKTKNDLHGKINDLEDVIEVKLEHRNGQKYLNVSNLNVSELGELINFLSSLRKKN